jgi:hypothetical protein
VSRLKNRSQLDSVPWLRGVIELTISGIDTVVAVIVEDN